MNEIIAGLENQVRKVRNSIKLKLKKSWYSVILLKFIIFLQKYLQIIDKLLLKKFIN